MVVESPPPQEQLLPAQTESLKPSSQAPTSEPAPMATTGESTVNGVDSANEGQRQQQHHGNNIPNGMSPVYPYPPPPGAMYPMSMPPEMFQGPPGAPGQRMMYPVPFPFPPPQPGQPGQPMSPNGYAYPHMMAPPPPSANGNASPSSPTGSPMPPYPSYGMWYPAPPGMGMPPPPGAMPQNGMQPIPMPMGQYPPGQPMYLPPQPQGEGQNGTENGQAPKPPQGEGQNGVGWTPGPGGLPPKAVAQTIPCRYFPDCRFGSSCWFLHPGADSSGPSSPPSNQQDSQPRPFFPGQLPPPVRYGPTGSYDPSSPAPNPNENPSEGNKSSYPSPTAGPNPSAASYGLMYAPYPYPNGYPPMYPPQPNQPQQSPNGGTSQSPSQPSQSQPMSPQHMAHQLQQNPPSQPQSPPPNMPGMYQANGTQGGWYPGPFPPGMPMQGVPMQPMSPSHPGQGMMPISPVSPSMGHNGAPIHGMGMPPQAMSPGNAPAPLQSPQHHPGHPPYPISPPYTAAPLHPSSPPQPMHPVSPQAHPSSPQALYGNQQPPNVAMMPPRGHHSRRESMSSMSAVPMGQVLGPHLDGNGTVDGSRSPPSAFRDMMDGGSYGPGARRGRGGHSSRGSWNGGNGFNTGRKMMACAFFPAGKCKNGDSCRFPHILNPDGSAPVSPTSPRGGYPGSFGRVGNGSRRPTILGPTLEDKMADLSVKEQAEGQENGDGGPRSAGYPKPYSSSPKTRGARASLSTPSTPGHRQNTHLQSLQQQQLSQRLPSADDFPVLGTTATPPPPAPAVAANGHGYTSAWNGPTAAQVLKGGIATKKAGGPAASSSVNGDTVKGTLDAPEVASEDGARAPETAVVEATA